MLAGQRWVLEGDSTTLVGYDSGDPVPDTNDSFRHLIEAQGGIVFHDFSAPAKRMTPFSTNRIYGLTMCDNREGLGIVSSLFSPLLSGAIYCIGFNDFKHDPISLERFKAEYKAKVISDFEKYSIPAIVLLTPFPTLQSEVNAESETLDDYRDAVEDIATEVAALGHNCYSIDTSSWVPSNSAYFLIDGVHLRENAHASIASNLYTAMQGLGLWS